MQATGIGHRNRDFTETARRLERAGLGHERSLTIVMSAQTRSLNLATAVGIVLYEAVRQVAAKAAGA